MDNLGSIQDGGESADDGVPYAVADVSYAGRSPAGPLEGQGLPCSMVIYCRRALSPRASSPSLPFNFVNGSSWLAASALSPALIRAWA